MLIRQNVDPLCGIVYQQLSSKTDLSISIVFEVSSSIVLQLAEGDASQFEWVAQKEFLEWMDPIWGWHATLRTTF